MPNKAQWEGRITVVDKNISLLWAQVLLRKQALALNAVCTSVSTSPVNRLVDIEWAICIWKTLFSCKSEVQQPANLGNWLVFNSGLSQRFVACDDSKPHDVAVFWLGLICDDADAFKPIRCVERCRTIDHNKALVKKTLPVYLSFLRFHSVSTLG